MDARKILMIDADAMRDAIDDAFCATTDDAFAETAAGFSVILAASGVIDEATAIAARAAYRAPAVLAKNIAIEDAIESACTAAIGMICGGKCK